MRPSNLPRPWFWFATIMFGIVMLGIVKPGAHYIAANGGWHGFLIAMAVIFGAAFWIERSSY